MAQGLAVGTDTPLRVIDVGGASTELVVGRGLDIEQMVSHRVGSVRLTERFVGSPAAPIGADALEAIAAATREALATQTLPPLERLYGVAGTVTTAAAMALGLERYERERVDGTRMSTGRVLALRDELARQDLAGRLTHPSLSPKRADVIVAGLTILHTALMHCGAQELVVRDRGVRYAYIDRA